MKISRSNLKIVFGIIPILIISGSIVAYSGALVSTVEDQKISEESYTTVQSQIDSRLNTPSRYYTQPQYNTLLSNQFLREQSHSSSKIPESLLKYLSDEDRLKLEQYNEYLTEFSDEDLVALQMYEEKLKELEDPNQSSMKAYEYFVNQIDTQTITKDISSDELPNFEESFQSIFFQDSAYSSSYSLLDYSSNDQEVESTTIQNDQQIETITQVKDKDYTIVDKILITDNQEITSRSMASGNWNMTEITTITGKPTIRLIEPDLSDLENLSVPIKFKENSGQEANEEVEWIRKTIDAQIGYVYELPGFDKRLDLTVLIVKFKAWAIFETGFHFVFPVRLTIEYPAEVIQGGQYSLKVTLDPLDIPDYEEFLIEFILDIGVGIDILLPKLTIKWIPIYLWFPFIGWKKVGKIPIPILSFYWFALFNFPVVDYYFKMNDTYATPLAGDSVNIDLGLDLDVLPIIAELNIPYVSAICGGLSIFMEAGVGLGYLEVFGNAVTGNLMVSAGDSLSTNIDVGWTEAGEMKALAFTIPFSEEEFLGLSVSDLVFHASEVNWVPEYFVKFKEVDVIYALLEQFGEDVEIPDYFPKTLILPLNEWWSQFRYPIYSFPLGELHIAGQFAYAISTSTISDSDIYDFTMGVNEIIPMDDQGKLLNVNTNDQLYQISLQNTYGANDVVELEVLDLPNGYTATFDRAEPHYEISSTQSTVNLIISPPAHVDVPPGDVTFSIKATSQGKRLFGVSEDFIIKTATLSVPEIIDLSLELDLPTHPSEVIQMTPNMVLPIKFLGKNLGNVDDNFTITATLYSTETNLQTWEQSFLVSPYGSGTGQYYSGEFSFSFSKTDLFPPPGFYTLDVQATSQNMPTVTKLQRRVVHFNNFYDLETSISPASTTMVANYVSTFILTVNNTGNTRTNFTLSSGGWDIYLDYPSKVLNVEPGETREIPIKLNITNPLIVKPDDYIFRIITSADGSQGTILSVDSTTVTVLKPDYVAPSITYIPRHLTLSGDLRIPQSTLTFNLEWEAFDEFPDSFTVYIDDLVYQTGTWQANTPIKVPVTGINPLSVGDHNITIIFTDQVGNIASDEVWVTIAPVDTTDPFIQPVTSPLTLPQNFAFSHYLIWNCTEEYLFNATIYRNGSKLSPENLYIQKYPDENDKFFVKLGIEPGSLGEATWYFTLFVQDMNNNTASSTISVIITPADLDTPQLLSINGSSAYLMGSGNISFIATDGYPDRYELWINSSLEINTTWQSGVPVILNVDELDILVGDSNLELYLFDLSGQYNYLQWIFALQDINAPTLVVKPSDFTVYEHNYTEIAIPYWEIQDFDHYPGTYQIFLDGTLLEEGIWTFGNAIISMPLRNLLPGVHTYNAYIRDATGNTLFSTVEVTVLDILAPFIWPHNPIQYESLYTASWFEFFISESHPDTYTLFRDGVKIKEGSMSGGFPFIFVDISSLPPGQYVYQLEVLDESGNLGVESVSVSVTDNNPPIIKKPLDLVYSEGTNNHSITFEIFEANPQSYSLFLDGNLIDSGVLLEGNFTFSVDSLPLGIHEYTLVVYDEAGFSHSSSVYVAVVDLTAPSISHLSDCQFVVGDTFAELIWEVYDTNPDTYSIKLGENFIKEDKEWSGNTIELKLVGWALGVYNVELIISDQTGNTASDVVIVTLIEDEQITSITTQQGAPGFELLTVLLSLTVIFVLVQRRKLKN
ncbi:MAG: hypothetical protein HeimC3_07710 [Candidatus Heimdallarchaeota archaeon LC_3]|nr:MAG: hypothetical protein HeimC3_07710 [Candidatus Heimdallarchaeota archaeon LC_3]